MSKQYLVTYKNGKEKVVNGNIRFFSSVDTCNSDNLHSVYLNAEEVLSVEHVKNIEEGEMQDGN